LKSKLGMLEDTLELAKDKSINPSMGKIDKVAEEEIVIMHQLEAWFKNEKGILREIYRELQADPEVLKLDKSMERVHQPKKFTIEFEDVSFRYSEESDYIFRNFSCVFEGGKTHGIISQSGLGKTTFLNLAVGLLQPTSGRVLVNGIDINSPDYSPEDLMSHTAYITQNTHLFMESILTNILLGNLPFLKELKTLMDQGKITPGLEMRFLAYKVLQSLDNAQGLDFVQTQSEGLNTLIGDKVALEVNVRGQGSREVNNRD
jgi:ABC-type multidrug transport system fused ATPase/permease subunit